MLLSPASRRLTSLSSCRRCRQALQLLSHHRASSNSSLLITYPHTTISQTRDTATRHASTSTTTEPSSSDDGASIKGSKGKSKSATSRSSRSTASDNPGEKGTLKTASQTKTTTTTTTKKKKDRLVNIRLTPDPERPRLRVAHELYSITTAKYRQSVANEETAKTLVDKMALQTLPDNLVLLDIYSGLGYLSQAALEHSNVRQVIGIEDHHPYMKNMENILEESAGRFAHVALDPFWWDTYRVLDEKGLFANVQKKAWQEDPPNLAMMGVIPASINGERLVIQQLSCIAGRMWLYRFGRMPSYLLVSGTFKERIMAPAGTSKRHKTSVMLEMLVDIEELVPIEELQPAKQYFKAPHSRTGDPKFCLLKFTPKRERLISSQDDLEVLEFLAKNMFVHRGSKWGNSLKYLAPGASILTDMVKEQGHEIDPDTRPQYLTSKDWLELLVAFKRWPFKPSYLDHDDIRNEADLLE